MKNYLIKDLKFMFGVNEDIVSTVCFSENGIDKWLSCVEVFGIPGFYLTDSDVSKELSSGNEDVYNKLNENNFINSFGDITLGEYDEIFESFQNTEKPEDVRLLRLLIYLTRCEMGEVEDVINNNKGKQIEEIEDLISEDEEYFLDEE